MLCILYVNTVGGLLSLVGLLVERGLPTISPRRWLWCFIIPASIVLPGFYRAHHTASVTELLQHREMQSPPGGAQVVASFAPLDPAWWAQVQSYDAFIDRAWLTASALLLVWGLLTAWRVAKLVRTSRRRAWGNEPVLIDGVPVVVTDGLGPATVGLWPSRVLVPRWVLALPGMQRRYVLRHEDEHRRSHDAQLLFAASLLLLLMPWNLALWWQLRRLRFAVEMDCDNRVVSALGGRSAYGELLLKVAQAGNCGHGLQPALLGGVGMLERRLTALLAPKPVRHVQRLLVPAVAFGLLLLVLSLPHPVLGSDGHAHDKVKSVVPTTTPSATSQR